MVQFKSISSQFFYKNNKSKTELTPGGFACDINVYFWAHIEYLPFQANKEMCEM